MLDSEHNAAGCTVRGVGRELTCGTHPGPSRGSRGLKVEGPNGPVIQGVDSGNRLALATKGRSWEKLLGRVALLQGRTSLAFEEALHSRDTAHTHHSTQPLCLPAPGLPSLGPSWL